MKVLTKKEMKIISAHYAKMIDKALNARPQTKAKFPYKQYLSERGLVGRNVAADIGINATHFSKIINNRQNMTISVLCAILNYHKGSKPEDIINFDIWKQRYKKKEKTKHKRRTGRPKTLNKKSGQKREKQGKKRDLN